MAIFDDLLGSVFRGFTGGAPPLVTEILLPWANKVGLNALARWSPIVATRIRCGIPVRMGSPQPCSNQAVFACGCCKAPICLDHAMVASNADVICLRCVNEAVKIIQEKHANDPPPRARQRPMDDTDREEQRRKHLKTLGFDEDDEPEFDEIKAAYRKLVAKEHPDRVPEEKRKAQTRKFLKIQAAWEFFSDDAKRDVA